MSGRNEGTRGLIFHEPLIFDRGGESFQKLEGLADFMTRPFDTHMRAGKIKLQHIGPVVFGRFGQIHPFIGKKPHDAGNDGMIRVILFQIQELRKIVLQGTIGYHLNILHRHFLFAAVINAVHPGRGMDDRQPIRIQGFKYDPAPAGIK